jgi:hypothetical protein
VAKISKAIGMSVIAIIGDGESRPWALQKFPTFDFFFFFLEG